jgi:hypothetical protein
MEDLNLHLSELKRALSGQRFFLKTNLRDFYRSRSPELSENTFRRILYTLEKRNLIRKIDRGVYILGNDQPGHQSQKKFIPTFSTELSALSNSIKAAFPFVEYLIWETKILHEFMLHQPGQNQIILETEKETADSVFNFLNDRHGGEVFLQPDRVTFERYILSRTDSIIVSNLITQSPHQKVKDIPCPKLEKILVDIYADDEKFYVFQGQELVRIFETVFERYHISEKALFRYAERRKVGTKIYTFVNRETKIQLIQQSEAGQ